jgi:molybdopterin synthase catalytic subunit
MRQSEIKRQRLLELFKRKEPIWKDEDHPELKDGAAAWIRKMRSESEAASSRYSGAVIAHSRFLAKRLSDSRLKDRS